MAARTSRRAGDTKRRRDIYADSTAAVLAALARGTVPWRRPWSVAGGLLPRNATTGATYRGINIVQLLFAGRESPWWMTFKQALSLDACVRRGETGTTCAMWNRTRRRLSAEEVDEYRARGERVDVDERGPYVDLVFAKAFTLFNAEQVDGLDPAFLPQIRAPSWEPLQEADRILADYDGPALQIAGSSAHYTPATDTVTMPDRGRFAATGDWYAVRFHEEVHGTGHPDRLARDMTGAFGSPAYAREELTAELGAAMLCAILQLDSAPLIERHAAYVDHWRKVLTDDQRLLTHAAQRAQRAADLILGDHDAIAAATPPAAVLEAPAEAAPAGV